MAAMLSRFCGLTFFLLASAFTLPALAEDGYPYYYFVFEGAGELPRNTLVPLHGANGVPFGFETLELEEPRVTAGKQSVPLKIVDSYDDLEGHTTPFPEGDSGYGENLILFAPAEPLAAKTLYSFMIGEHRLATLRIGDELDHEPPARPRPPFLISRAYCPRLAAERHHVVLPTRFAVKVREAPSQNPAVQVPVQLFRHELRQCAAAGFVGPLLLEGQQVFLHHTEKRCLLRLPPDVGRAGGLGLDAGRCLHIQDLSANRRRLLPASLP
jgi:hypothetical protein